jgi:mRNA interferase MazF
MGVLRRQGLLRGERGGIPRRLIRLARQTNLKKSMKKEENPRRKHFNITLQDATIALLFRVVPDGARSAFIERAIRNLVETEGKQNLRAFMNAEALANDGRDFAIAAEWVPAEGGRADFRCVPEGNDENRTDTASPKRGEVYLVASGPTDGREAPKTRPFLVIQNDVSNRTSPITVVAAISPHFADPPSPREVPLPPGSQGEQDIGRPSAVILNHLHSIERGRLVRRIATLDAATMRKVDQALDISLGLIDL